MNIVVIPARGGSKRIKKKNIREFCGKPMIAWPIEILRKSRLFDHIIISTDNREIAEISKSFGAEIPFMRPTEISDDYSGIGDVMEHAVKWMKNNDLKPSAVCCVYPTSVFLENRDLLQGLNELKSGEWNYVFSVTNFSYPIFRSFKRHSDGGVEMFFPEKLNYRSQDLPEVLHDAALFYWGKPEAWEKKYNIFDRYSYPITIPNWRVKDIDTEDDLIHAEQIFSNIKNI